MAEMNSISRFFVNLSASRRAARYFEWIRRNVPIPAAASCLEIGCGNAAFAARFVEGFVPAQYLATDFDRNQLQAARLNLGRRYPRGVPPSLVLGDADMLHLPFADSSFDVVLTFLTLHHASPNHQDFTPVPVALSEISRVLRPSGMLVYEEFLHKESIRRWLVEHGYSIEQLQGRWRRERVMARRTDDPGRKIRPPWDAKSW